MGVNARLLSIGVKILVGIQMFFCLVIIVLVGVMAIGTFINLFF